MANIICVTSGLRGLVNASFEVASRLRQAGHSVSYASPQPIESWVAAQGLPYTQLAPVNFDPAPEPPRVHGFLSRLRSRLAEWTSAGWRRQEGIEALGMDGFREFLQTNEPDLLLIDAELYEHIFTARSEGVRVVLLTPFFPTWQRPGLPPLQSAIQPGRGLAGSRLGLYWTWTRLRVRRWMQITMISLRHAFTERRAVLRSYAKQVGFPARALEQYGWSTLFNFRQLPVFSLTARELDFPHQPPDWVHYVGPMVATKRIETTVETDTAARLEKLYAEKAERECALIYCWLTTMDEEDKGFLGRVVAGLAEHSEWLLVIGHSGGAAAGLGSLPGHIQVFDYVPQLEILQHTDVCITQGGMNTIHECLLLEVPMLVYPSDFADKPGTAARLDYHHLCHCGDIDGDRPVDIARRVWSILADRDLGPHLARCRQQLEHYREDAVLETLVQQQLSKPSAGP